ncbi:hypothetical protein B0H13DRAFT_1519596, partial [Mycena leptocephala]
EGLDRKLVLSYHAHWTFAIGTLPALRRAGVLSVLGVVHGPNVHLADLGLVAAYTGTETMDTSTSCTDLMVEVRPTFPSCTLELAARSSTLAFTHGFPSFVNTPLL